MEGQASLVRMSEFCLALPEAAREDTGHNRTSRVRRKPSAYFLDNHHGDEIAGLWCKVLPGDNHALIRSDPSRFYMPAYVGSKGWAGLRLDVGDVDWEEVLELVCHSYLLLASKSLCVKVSSAAGAE